MISIFGRSMGESNAVRIRRPLVRQATAKRAAEIYAEKFGDENGSIPATYQVPSYGLPLSAG